MDICRQQEVVTDQLGVQTPQLERGLEIRRKHRPTAGQARSDKQEELVDEIGA
jgi:hypothetical protein